VCLINRIEKHLVEFFLLLAGHQLPVETIKTEPTSCDGYVEPDSQNIGIFR
jgi:hypothetical protein